jgi:hypothetical protein
MPQYKTLPLTQPMLPKIVFFLLLLVHCIACNDGPDDGEPVCDGCGDARLPQPVPVVPLLAAAIAPMISHVSHDHSELMHRSRGADNHQNVGFIDLVELTSIRIWVSSISWG